MFSDSSDQDLSDIKSEIFKSIDKQADLKRFKVLIANDEYMQLEIIQMMFVNSK